MTDPRAGDAAAPGVMLERSYSIAGVPCTVTAEAALLEPIDLTYRAYAADHAPTDDVYSVRLSAEGSGVVVSDSEGQATSFDREVAPIGALDAIVRHVVAGLARRGIYAIHAASLASPAGGLIVSGRSGFGKTTLAIALLTRGFKLLSDEFALSAPDGSSILPYRRAVHIRPPTPQLIGELGFLSQRPRLELGGGSEWSLLPHELDEVFPGCLGEAAELSHVLLLGPRTPDGASVLEPIPGALAAIELVRAAPAAGDEFQSVLARMNRLTEAATCARLHPGALESSLDVIARWTGAPAGAGSRG